MASSDSRVAGSVSSEVSDGTSGVGVSTDCTGGGS